MLAGAYAFRAVFDRQGETALRLVPIDAVAYGAMDLTPSPSQTLVFKKIEDAIGRNKMDGMMDKSLVDMFASGNPTVLEIKPFAQRGAAMAMIPLEDGKTNDVVFMLGVSDGPAVNAILKKKGRPEFWRGTQYWKVPQFNMGLMVVDNTLVISSQPASFNKIRHVHDGDLKSVTSDPEFQATRQGGLPDANIQIYYHADALQTPQTIQGMPHNLMGVSLAIRDEGVEIKTYGKVDPKNEFTQKMAKAAPIRSDLMQVLPDGAYGLISIAQPSVYFEATEGLLKDMDQFKKGISEMEDGMQKNMGMSLRDDLLPALKGDAVIGLYPNSMNDISGLDALVIFDESNGANPDNALARFQRWADREIAKESKSNEAWNTSIDIPGAKGFKLAGKLQESMTNGIKVNDPSIRTEKLTGHATVAWAIVDHTVIASTSEALLRHAVETYRAKTASLASDARYVSFSPDGSQTLAVFNPSRIAEGILGTANVDKMEPNTAKSFQSIIDIVKGLKGNLSLKGGVSPDGTCHGSMFIPLDYDKMFDFAGDMMKTAQRTSEAPAKG